MSFLPVHGADARNTTIWKPAPSTPLCAIAVTKLITPVLERNGLPGATAALVTGGVDVGKEIVGSSDLQLGSSIVLLRAQANESVSFTGSEKVGRKVGKAVQDRFGKVSNF